MSSEEKDISKIFRERTLIDKAIVLAAKSAVLQHIQQGQPLPVWRDSKTVFIPPEQLAEWSILLDTQEKNIVVKQAESKGGS
jgi:hypothetical protein